MGQKQQAGPVYDPENRTLRDPRTGKVYPVEEVPAGLRLGKPTVKK
jgi:hypothetical protein